MGMNGWSEDSPLAQAYRGYEPVVNAVEAELGVSVDLWNTGGNCMAFGAELEGGVEILITDAADILSPWQWRVDAKARGEQPFGYMVGVYANTENGNDPVIYTQGNATESPEGVVALVRRALEEARARGFVPAPDYVEPIQLDVL